MLQISTWFHTFHFSKLICLFLKNYNLPVQQFCQRKNLVITDTWFQVPPRRLYTWTSPQHNEQNCVRNQFDYILVKERFRNNAEILKMYPGAVVPTDHTLTSATIRVCLTKKQKPDMTLLKVRNTKSKVIHILNERIKTLSTDCEPETIEAIS